MKEEKFFILTNPLFWMWAIIMLLWGILRKGLVYLGILDWYYVLFRFDKIPKRGKRVLLELNKNKDLKMFWLKRKAFEYAINEILKRTNKTN